MKSGTRSPGVLRQILDSWQPSESIILGGAAIGVGLASGIGVWLFKSLIVLTHDFVYNTIGINLGGVNPWLIALIPVAGGLVVGLIMYFFIGAERHHGVAGVMEAVALAGGRLRFRRMPIKAIASALSIGTGASVGPEDPSVQIGANFGSMLGQWMHLSDERMRSLVAAGAASGIGAAFNAPIAGVFFALEIVLGEISGSSFGIVVISAVISAVFTQAVTGTTPAFQVPPYAFGSVWELPLYLGLGLLAGPVGALYVRGLYRAQDIFQMWVRIPRWLKPALAGLLVGLVGVLLPQILGVGYDTIESILLGKSVGLTVLIILLFAKLIMTSVCIAGGFPGGVFAPSLFIGAMLGAAYGGIMDGLFPILNISPPAFAMVGMAAVLAGAVHSPLTAIILLFEMTDDYHIILPLMFAVVVSMLLAQRLQSDSVYTLSLARKGIRLERGRDVEVLETLTVEEVMTAEPDALHERDSLRRAADVLADTRHHGLPVLNDQGELVGIFTIQDLDHTRPSTWSLETVGEVCTRELLVTYPDETIGMALRKMGARDVGRIPVVERINEKHMVGLLRRGDLVRAYDIALTNRAAMRHRAHQVRLGASSQGDVSIEEIEIEPNAPCAGKRLGDIKWPRESIIASVRRGRMVRIPHGDTVLRAGDVVVAVSGKEVTQDVRLLCQGNHYGGENP